MGLYYCVCCVALNVYCLVVSYCLALVLWCFDLVLAVGCLFVTVCWVGCCSLLFVALLDFGYLCCNSVAFLFSLFYMCLFACLLFCLRFVGW